MSSSCLFVSLLVVCETEFVFLLKGLMKTVLPKTMRWVNLISLFLSHICIAVIHW